MVMDNFFTQQNVFKRTSSNKKGTGGKISDSSSENGARKYFKNHNYPDNIRTTSYIHTW